MQHPVGVGLEAHDRLGVGLDPSDLFGAGDLVGDYLAGGSVADLQHLAEDLDAVDRLLVGRDDRAGGGHCFHDRL